jgi:hypothetical protein
MKKKKKKKKNKKKKCVIWTGADSQRTPTSQKEDSRTQHYSGPVDPSLSRIVSFRKNM